MKEHPFSPVVRWALFPMFAALAGGGGGAILAVLVDGDFSNPGPAIMAGALGAGAAFASMLTTRAWPALLTAPVLSVSAVVSGMALLEGFESGTLPGPGVLFDRLSRQSEALLLIGSAAFLQTVVHHVAIRRPWAVGLASGAGAAALTFVFALLLAPERWRMLMGAFLAGATIAQVPAVLAARAVARRLRPREAA